MSEKIKSHCSSCNHDTNHTILFCHSVSGDKKDYSFYKEQYFMVIECMGCENVSYLTKHLIDIELEEEGEDPYFYSQYPEREFDSGEFEILEPEKYEQFPSMIRNLYAEVEGALHQDALLLAGLGLRTLVEAICVEQNIPGKDLKAKIINLQVQGLISTNELPILDKLRLIGNFSAHKIRRFSETQLGYALNIINHVLVSIYILPKISKKIKI